jgi:hypothetical protein
MITKEQAIEILKGDFSKVILGENESHSELFAEAFNMAIEALKGKDTNVHSKWIPCSERLPEKKTRVLITWRSYIRDIHMSFIARIREDNVWEDDMGGVMNDSNVIAWMPLSAPFKESED